jgi:hypothetical protein
MSGLSRPLSRAESKLGQVLQRGATLDHFHHYRRLNHRTTAGKNKKGIFTEPLPSNEKGIFTEPLPSNNKGIFTEPLPSNENGIFTEPLPSNEKGIFTEPLPSNEKGTFIEPLPSNDKGGYTLTHTYAHRQQRDLISLLNFLK